MQFFSHKLESLREFETDIPSYQQSNHLQKNYSIPLYSCIFYLNRSIKPELIHDSKDGKE